MKVNNMSTAYCIQESFQRDNASGEMKPRDLSSASRFGQVEFLLQPHEKAAQNPDLTLERLMMRLESFDPTRDFIFTAGGDPLAFALTVAALKELDFTYFQYLRWERDRQNGGGFYVSVRVPLV